MRITDITSSAYRIPLSEKWVSAKYLITHHEYVVTEIETDRGVTGVGWCSTIGVGALAIVSLIESYMAPMLLGEDPRNVERIWTKLWEDSHFAGPGGLTTLAIATIDIALWDIRAKDAGLPLYQLIGGMKDVVDVYASAVNLHLTEDQLLEQVEGHLALGYEVFKLKIGRQDPAEDLNRTRAVRKVIGKSRTLLLDVNQKWKAAEAVSRLRVLAEIRPGWIEEPLLSDDIDGHVHVRAHGGIPVAVGEQLCNRFEFWNYVKRNAADVLQPNVWKVGGITEWLKVAHMAQHANLLIAPHDSLELSVHLVAAVANGYMVENIFGGNLTDLGIIEEPVIIESGRVRLPRKPGHGIAFNKSALSRFVLAPGSVIEREPAVHAGQ